MKGYQIFGIIVALILIAVLAFGQIQNMWVSSGSATTTWTKLQKTSYARIVEFELSNDETSGAAELYFAFNDDTTSTRRFGLKWGESMNMKGINVTHLYIRSSTGTIAYRARYH